MKILNTSKPLYCNRRALGIARNGSTPCYTMTIEFGADPLDVNKVRCTDSLVIHGPRYRITSGKRPLKVTTTFGEHNAFNSAYNAMAPLFAWSVDSWFTDNARIKEALPKTFGPLHGNPMGYIRYERSPLIDLRTFGQETACRDFSLKWSGPGSKPSKTVSYTIPKGSSISAGNRFENYTINHSRADVGQASVDWMGRKLPYSGFYDMVLTAYSGTNSNSGYADPDRMVVYLPDAEAYSPGTSARVAASNHRTLNMPNDLMLLSSKYPSGCSIHTLNLILKDVNFNQLPK